MTREMEYAKCMAVLRKIVRLELITENEYVAVRNKLMDKYLVVRDFDNRVIIKFFLAPLIKSHNVASPLFNKQIKI